MDVWYVSYGSNLCEDRFMCYINGDRPLGSDQRETGCHDKTPPKASRKAAIPYPLYFAKEQSKWGIGGVAFIGHDQNVYETTIGRMFLITDEQFSEVVSQENNKRKLRINFSSVIARGYQQITDGWYGRIIYLGDKEGYPMFTFTSNAPMDKYLYNKPSSAYLSTIANGLLELGLGHSEIIDYFYGKRGIKGHFSREKLFNYTFG
ncbi:hypothetical protein [Virgibacillus oceani]|uniref:Histone deacetylase n=1 Tax=Virgibacillus oceani TaxID=1479511 RepID=A0A917H5Q7_9BACI|nr:hypothetical protein [Virgibacillus oceani]GGG68035.1 hypothetical protein GCM10011398_09800 [Virgibacillus oceani]